MSAPLRTPSIRRNHHLHSKGGERKEVLQQGIRRTHSGCWRGGTVGCLGACGHVRDRNPSICANDGWVSTLLILTSAQPIAYGLAPFSITAGFVAILCSLSNGQATLTTQPHGLFQRLCSRHSPLSNLSHVIRLHYQTHWVS